MVIGSVVVVGAGLVLGSVLSAVLDAASVQVAWWYCGVLVAAAAALTVLAKAMTAELELPIALQSGPVAPIEGPTDLLAPLERRLSAAARERRLFLAGLQPVLWDLARERIRLHKAVDLDNARADGTGSTLVGEELWTWLTTTQEQGPAPTGAQLERMIAAVERL